MTTNAPYHIEFYSNDVANESDPNPTLEYDARTPSAIYANVERMFHDAYEITTVEIDDPTLDPLTTKYHVYRDGHESSHGTLVGTMYVTAIS